MLIYVIQLWLLLRSKYDHLKFKVKIKIADYSRVVDKSLRVEI